MPRRLIELSRDGCAVLHTPAAARRELADCGSVPLDRLIDVPALCVTRVGVDVVELPRLHELDLGGCALLLRTLDDPPTGPDGGDPEPTTEAAKPGAHASVALSDATVRAIVAVGLACVGIDRGGQHALDGSADLSHWAHTLLAAGIPVIKGLSGLGALPRGGFCFTAAPPALAAPSHPVRAFATIDSDRWISE
jgi:arylformamidase